MFNFVVETLESIVYTKSLLKQKDLELKMQVLKKKLVKIYLLHLLNVSIYFGTFLLFPRVCLHVFMNH